MRIYERDYRYLLLHVVPRHRLPAAVRRGVDHALVTGSTHELRRQSLRALEALCESAYLTRVGVRPDNGDVVVEYKKSGGRFRLSIAVPSDEWEGVGGPSETVEVEPPRPEPEAEPAPPPAQAPPGDAYEFVTDIVRSFAIADRSVPMVARLESLLETLQRLVEVVSIRLFFLEDVVAEDESRGELVQVLSDSELRATEVLKEAVESGAQRLFARAEVEPGQWRADAGDWSVLGAAPIYSMGKVHGVLCALFPPALDRSTMSSRLSVASETVRRIVEYHSQIENMTSFDALMRIYNRHFFDDQLPVEIERATRSGSVLSMLVIDLDDFKRVNDELGHKKGDEALTAVAEIIRRNLRKVDLPFRYGGEEIVILLPGTSELESVHTAERLRRVIAQYDRFLDHHGQPHQLTVSVGVSVYPDIAKSADELFMQADAAMFRAKGAGKNRVVLYRDEEGTGDE
jgi:diguanylate cyclase (GGDEF)-like protein